MLPPELELYLRSELESWAAEFVLDRVAQLNRRGIKGSGDLANSLSAEVRGQAVDAAVQALVSFKEYGRFVDMRTLQPGEAGADYITNLVSWIQRKGLAEKFTRGYVRKRNLKKPPERVLSYIAFGIAKKRNQGKYRRRRWYNSSKTAAINELYNDVQANMPDIIAEQIADTLTGVRSSSVKVKRKSSGSDRGGRSLAAYAKAKGRE